jgi:hypothetical protein
MGNELLSVNQRLSPEEEYNIARYNADPKFAPLNEMRAGEAWRWIRFIGLTGAGIGLISAGPKLIEDILQLLK